MSSVDLVPPRLPNAPTEYDFVFMADLIRALEVFINQQTNPGEGRATKITFTNLPTSDTGLEEGAVYRIDNRLYISLIDFAVPDGLVGSSSVGSVSVTTT